MALDRGINGEGPFRPDGGARAAALEQERRARGSSLLGFGTLACPRCDVPVGLADAPVAPADGLRCPFCDHAAAARDFLSLAPPTRPTRVAVRLVLRSPVTGSG